jgi:hypothetical protein
VALAPADFYAYSRATGQPYPESPEERAAQASEVLEFRRNQLKSQEFSSSNPIALGLGIGLGLAGLGGASLAARRMLQSGKAKGQSGSYQADLSNYDAAQIREAGRYKPASVAPSKVAMDASVAPVQRTVDIQTAVDDEVTRLLNDPGLLKFVEAEEADIINRLPEMRAEQSRQQGQVRRALSATADDILLDIRTEPTNTLVTQQQATGGSNVKQAMAALESGEDQQTGRMKNQLQRNEDLDLGQVEILEDIASQQRNFMMEQDEPINSVASKLPDGLPVDQAESTGRLGSYTLGRASDADLSQSSAANFLQQRRLKLLEDAEAGTPARLEKKLADAFGPEAWREDPKATRRRNALKLGAAGNEQFFENLNEGTVTIAGEQFPVSSLKEGVYMEDTAQNLLNKGDAYRDWLGNIRLEETRNQIKLANQLDDLLAQDKILQGDTGEVALGAAKKSQFFSSPQERDAYITEERTASRGREIALDLQDEIDGRVNELLRSFEMSEKRLAGAEKATSRNLQRLSVPQKLMSGVEEGIVVRPILTAPDNIPMLEGELSNIERGRPVGQFISQEQLEVVPGGLLSGGRARSVSNIGQDIGFDPETGERIVVPLVDETGERIVQKLAGKRMGEDVGVRGRGGVAGLDTKASIGIYGPELSEYGTAAQTKTGQYTQEASQVPSLVNPIPVQKVTGGYFTYPQQREADSTKYAQKAVPEASRASVDVSESVRKARDPQALLRSKMAELGVSAIGDFSPYPRRR